MFVSVIESRDFGSAFGKRAEVAGRELSEFGGEGGVGASDMVDEADFVGGVGMVGEEVEVLRE